MRGRKLGALVLALVIGLSGCGWMDGSYVSVTPHQVGLGQSGEETVRAVSGYTELRSALVSMIDSGSTRELFSLAEYPREEALADMEQAVAYAMGTYPIGAYTVEDIAFNFGTGLGAQAMSVVITYRHSREEIERIQTVRGTDGAEAAVADALNECADVLVLQITGYQDADLAALALEYARQNPDRVMEVPAVQVQVWPDRGSTRVAELTFTYQTDRQTLRAMREEVQPVFSSAALYVSGQAGERVKYGQLYTFLTERFDYTIETSVTPAHSLLCRGVGDSQAFARVYAAMCSRIGLEVRTVRGTREGEVRWWNLVRIDGMWYHVDLLAPEGFRTLTDAEMTGYDWDREAYPAAAGTDA